MQSKKCITSTGLKTTGSFNGFLGIGMPSGDQCCLSVTRYKKRNAEVAVLMLEAESLRDIVRFFLRVIAQSLQSCSPGVAQLDKAALHIGAVAFIHRFGSSLNGHVHFHACVVDGVFEEVPGEGDADVHASPPGIVFHPATGIDADAVAQV